MSNLYIIMVVSAGISFLITPLIRKFAINVNAVDVPKDNRRVHNKPTPYLGGLAIYVSFFITFFIQAKSLQKSDFGIILGATIIVIGGVIDDFIDIKPWIKLIFQLSAAIILILCGVNISIVTNPFDSINIFYNIGWISYPLTILWVVGITNALNLIDGLDGLAAGVAFISCITIFVIALLNGRFEAAILLAILSGAILGFLPFNFNPASIFMGDAGAQLLGFLLAAISMQGAIKSATAFAMGVPVLAIGLPIYDTIFAIIRRKINGKPISQGDKGHLHHRLLEMGLSQKQAVIVMYTISAVLGIISIIAMEISTVRSYFLLTGVLIIIVLAAWKFGLFKLKDS
ncbi:MAG: MraY family glycosyltransferase [Bacillota bacterium]|nr:MraY family glycosyltransferase [Bacillota bacterium]